MRAWICNYLQINIFFVEKWQVPVKLTERSFCGVMICSQSKWQKFDWSMIENKVSSSNGIEKDSLKSSDKLIYGFWVTVMNNKSQGSWTLIGWMELDFMRSLAALHRSFGVVVLIISSFVPFQRCVNPVNGKHDRGQCAKYGPRVEWVVGVGFPD